MKYLKYNGKNRIIQKTTRCLHFRFFSSICVLHLIEIIIDTNTPLFILQSVLFIHFDMSDRFQYFKSFIFPFIGVYFSQNMEQITYFSYIFFLMVKFDFSDSRFVMRLHVRFFLVFI